MRQQARPQLKRDRLFPFLKALGVSGFWLWNVLFATTIYMGILPFIGFFLIQAAIDGQVPAPFVLSLSLILSIPAASMGLAPRFLRQASQLMKFFYGVELPLMLLVMLRLFALRELDPAGSFVLWSVILAIGTYGWNLLRGDRAIQAQTQTKAHSPHRQGHGIAAIFQISLNTLVLLVGLYVSAILLIYAIPILVGMALVFGLWVAGIGLSVIHLEPFALIAFAFGSLFWLSAALLALMPPVLSALYIQAGQQRAFHFAKRYGRRTAISLGLATLTTWVILFAGLGQQPQVQAFELIDAGATSGQAKQALLQKSDQIRDGLVNAYLSDYRYVSSIDANRHVRDMYKAILPRVPIIPDAMQSIYNDLAAPFLYQNITDNDAEKAAKAYRKFFDQPIQKAEQSAINRALNATSNRDEAKAGLLNINQKKVLLGQQSLNVTEHGDWAEVELHETYRNVTNDVQEVFYSFSLPESAVITGLWLGDTPDRSQRFQPQVSPRGAAQKVYNAQVQRARPIDPALLEQVGPRHYRLRAFPVPVVPGLQRGRAIEASGDRPTEMNLWLTYNVMGDEQGWPMPQLGEKRNLYWSRKTQRSLNEASVTGSQDAWLPDHIAAQHQTAPTSHQFDLNGYRITAKPLQAQDYAQPQNQKVAVILDSSRSMESHRPEVSQALNWLKASGFAQAGIAQGNDVDLFISAPEDEAMQRLDDWQTFKADQFPFFGSIGLKQMLQQFEPLKGETPYDSVIVLTDGDTYAISSDGGDIPAPGMPLWMVHLGALPPAYDDAVLKLMQDSGGGVGNQLGEVLERNATLAQLGAAAVSDGYGWWVSKLEKNDQTLEKETSFSPLAARQLLNQLAKTTAADIPAELDRIHAIAKSQQIVTPYSSMIVLVNDDQRRQLAEAEAESDRFDRKAETGDETLEKPINPMATSVSTPEASGIVAFAIAGSLFIAWRRRLPGAATRIKR